MKRLSIAGPLLRSSRHTRLLLMAGFGGLLLLMVFAGVDAMQVFREAQKRTDAIRREFLLRNRLLNQIRSDLYLSGTYVRDYLLEPDPKNATRHLASLEKSKQDMTDGLQNYSRLLSRTEQQPYNVLQRELGEYWLTLEPVMSWHPDKRHVRGYEF